MLLLTSTSDAVQVVTGSSEAVDVHASWVDNASGTITPGRTNTAIASAATTVVVAAPAASTQRNVQTLNLRNTTAASNVLVTVRHTDGTTIVELIEYTLAFGEQLQYIDGVGWKVINATGQIRTEVAAGGTASVTSAEANAISAAAASNISVVSAAVVTNSAQMTSADNAISNAVSILSAQLSLQVSALSQVVSALSQANSAAHVSLMSAVSVESAARAAADISVMSAVSVESAARAAQAISIMSAVSVNSAQMTSANNAISAAQAATSAAAQLLSARISAGIGLSAQTRFFLGPITVSAAALTNIPSMSVSMEAGGIYKIEGAVIYNKAAVSGTHGFGFSSPSVAAVGGGYMLMIGTSAGNSQVGNPQEGIFTMTTFAGQTVVFSTSATAAGAQLHNLAFEGMFNVSGTAGVFQLMAKGSTAGTVTLILNSAYIRAFRIG